MSASRPTPGSPPRRVRPNHLARPDRAPSRATAVSYRRRASEQPADIWRYLLALPGCLHSTQIELLTRCQPHRVQYPPDPTENTSTSVIRSHKALSGPEKVAAIVQVNHLEGALFDGEGHVQRQTNPERANELLGAINKLRRQLGWLSLDMSHHQCWSDEVPAGPGR